MKCVSVITRPSVQLKGHATKFTQQHSLPANFPLGLACEKRPPQVRFSPFKTCISSRSNRTCGGLFLEANPRGKLQHCHSSSRKSSCNQVTASNCRHCQRSGSPCTTPFHSHPGSTQPPMVEVPGQEKHGQTMTNYTRDIPACATCLRIQRSSFRMISSACQTQ